MKTLILITSLLLTGCSYYGVLPGETGEPVYKYNPLEMRQELTHPDSKLRYNIYSQEWVYVK